MTETYSTYDAKARLSEILRKVEDGRTIYISRHGQPIAEVRPITREPVNLEDRMADLTKRGVLTVPTGDTKSLRPLAHRPGALGRFLDDRNR